MTVVMDRPIARSRWRSKNGRLAIAAGAALVLAAATAVMLLNPPSRTLRVATDALTIEPVARGLFRDFTPLQGKVVPRDTIYLDALEGGQVQKVLAQAGDRVVVGQPLIQFNNTQLELDVLDREGRLVESLTQLQGYEKQLEQTRAANDTTLAQIDYDIVRLKRASERRDVYAGKGVFPQEQLDQLHDELDHAVKLKPLQAESNKRQEALRLSQLPQIHAELASLQKSLAFTRGKLENLVVKAPVSGLLTVMDLKIGQNRNRGERLAEITTDTGFKISAEIDEFYLPRLRAGQIAEAQVDGKPRRLKVSRIYPQVKNGVFTVDLEFEGTQPRDLTPGAAVQGRLSLGEDAPALVLPAGAFLERSGGGWAFVLDRAGKRAVRRDIKIGRRSAEQVEVLSGLQPGEKVITSDYAGYEKLDRIDFK
jgi:HlyD family secretion protein